MLGAGNWGRGRENV